MSSIAQHAAHAAIRFYQLTFSAFAGRQCRYLPSCSDYMAQAIKEHGVWAGGWMGTARLCRCHPWSASGFDPVTPMLPPKSRWYMPWRYGLWRSPVSDPPAPPRVKDG